jgi:hypothetical protein
MQVKGSGRFGDRSLSRSPARRILETLGEQHAATRWWKLMLSGAGALVFGATAAGELRSKAEPRADSG